MHTTVVLNDLVKLFVSVCKIKSIKSCKSNRGAHSLGRRSTHPCHHNIGENNSRFVNGGKSALRAIVSSPTVFLMVEVCWRFLIGVLLKISAVFVDIFFARLSPSENLPARNCGLSEFGCDFLE
jgi:hypothetical protein